MEPLLVILVATAQAVNMQLPSPGTRRSAAPGSMTHGKSPGLSVFILMPDAARTNGHCNGVCVVQCRHTSHLWRLGFPDEDEDDGGPGLAGAAFGADEDDGEGWHFAGAAAGVGAASEAGGAEP